MSRRVPRVCGPAPVGLGVLLLLACAKGEKNDQRPTGVGERTAVLRFSLSRDTSANALPPATFGARKAYSSSDPPTTIARKHRMNVPHQRRGWIQGAHTEAGLPAQVAGNHTLAGDQFGREVAAAEEAANGDVGTAALTMASSLMCTPWCTS